MFDLKPVKDLFRLHLEDEPLLRAQLETMERQVPLLYIILVISIVTLSLMMYPSAPAELTVLFPAVVTGIIVYRVFAWANRPRGRLPIELVVRKLKILVGVAVVVTGLLCGWAALMTRFAESHQMAHIVSFSIVTVLTTVITLSPLGLAAMVALVLGGLTFLTTSLLPGNEALLSLSVSFCFVLAVVVLLLARINTSFVSNVHSRVELEELNQQALALNSELQVHKSSLEDQVRVRTVELQEQALKLEHALTAERELNEMQNQFVAMVSHEFRTPMTVIDGTARRIINRVETMESEDIVERMRSIRGSITRLSGLVERTLDASRLATGKIQCCPEPVELGALIAEIIERHRELATDFTFKVDLDAIQGQIDADPRLCDHIFSNLISNAIKYSKDKPVVDVTGFADRDYVGVKIRDHGIGIPKSELPRITERFFRASTSSGIQGTGIGLNLVNELVAMHHGMMSIDSEVGQWTEVTIRLPVCQKAAQESAAEVQPPDEVSARAL